MINWCKFGLHNYICYHGGLYKSFHKCKNCGKEKISRGAWIIDNYNWMRLN